MKTCRSIPKISLLAVLYQLLVVQESVASQKMDVSLAELFTSSLAYYIDSREFTTAAFNIASKPLPGGFSIWGFTDFHGTQGAGDFDLDRSFSEYRLTNDLLGKFVGIQGLTLQAEQNIVTGKGNDIARVGLAYRHNLPLPWGASGWLQWRAFPYETDNDGGQLSIVYSIPFSERIRIRGFADLNLNDAGDRRWVLEPELLVSFGNGWSALIEYRYNQYQGRIPGLNSSGIAVGLSYQIGK